MQKIIHVGKWSQKIEITDGRKQEKKPSKVILSLQQNNILSVSLRREVNIPLL